MAKNKKKSTRKPAKKSDSKTRQRKPKELTNIEKLKKMESDLYESCMKDVENISRQSGLSTDEVLEFIEKNGIEKIQIMKGVVMADGIFEIMVRNWNTLSQVQMIRARTEKANRKLFLREMEQEASILDERVAEIEDEEKFYTTKPDKEGKVHLKEKWFSEMEYWKEKLATADTEEKYKLAQAEIKKLKQKKTWMHTRNIMPNITKWMGKITKGINEVQGSMGEIAKPFADAGSGKGSKGGDYGFNMNTFFDKKSQDFDAEKMFSDKKGSKGGNKYF